MVKSVSSVSHQGVKDWVVQRVSALVMGVYSIALIAYIVLNPGLSFAEWHGLFTQTWMQIATLIFVAAILLHAWIGIWTVFTDYVKPYVIRSILNVLVILMLVACFFWSWLILWSL